MTEPKDFLDEVVGARTSENADFPRMVAEAEIARLKRRLRRQQIRLAYILACLGLLIGGVLLAENWALGCLAIGVNAGDSFRGWVEHD